MASPPQTPTPAFAAPAPNLLFIGQSNAAGRSRPYSPPAAHSTASLRAVRSDKMLAPFDPKKASAGYSPLNYLHYMYTAHHNFARGGTSLDLWPLNFEEWLPSRFDGGATDVVWIQGESDLDDATGLETYAVRLGDFFGRLAEVYRIERLFVVSTTVTREGLRSNAPALRAQQASAVESIRAEGVDARLISTEGVAMCGDGVHYSDRGCYEVAVRLERALANRQEVRMCAEKERLRDIDAERRYFVRNIVSCNSTATSYVMNTPPLCDSLRSRGRSTWLSGARGWRGRRLRLRPRWRRR